MSRHVTSVGLFALGIFALASGVQAEKPKKPDPAANDKEVVSSKVVKRPAAATINFRKELKLPFPTLGTLGPRIAAARRASDPVALAHAASELAVAEKVSGKKASLTSATVYSEAVELAKLRQQLAELQAVRQVSDQVANTEDQISSMRTVIADAQSRTQSEIEAYRRNEEPTFTPRKVVINNYTPQYLVIFMNGSYKAEVAPGMSQTFIVEQRYNPVVLTASGDDDVDSWGPRYIWGRFNKYTWNIN